MISTPVALTESEVRELATAWFTGLNEHWPLVDMLPLLATDDIRMVFPEATMTDLRGFEKWYLGVINLFFDQDHIIRDLTATIDGDKADVKVTVIWKASEWKPPAAFSSRIVMRAEQTWVVKRSAATGKPVIASYSVDSLVPTEDN